MYSNIVSSLSKTLELQYGKHQPENGAGLIDYLILGILSQNTADVNARRAFTSLMQTFRSYKAVCRAPLSEIESAIKHGGMQHIKACRIKQLLKTIWSQHYSFDMNFLKDMDPNEAKNYLASFKGVGLKTACYALLFGLNVPVMPVDTHILRITRRLGLVDSDTGPKETHNFYQQFLPKEKVFNMHLNLIEHGRKVCKTKKTACPECVINEKCKSNFLKILGARHTA